MKKISVLFLIVFIVLLAGCTLPSGNEDGDLDPTSAEIVRMTVAAAQTMVEDGDGDVVDGDQPDITPSATQPVLVTQSATSESDSDDDDDGEHGTDQARFVSDVTIPDYTNVSPGEEITKTWRLQNMGTATWTTEYALVFDDEDQMGAPDRVPLTAEVPPNGFVNISVDFIAPDTAGEYSSYWLLENDKGEVFGTGGEFDQPIWMIVVVATDDVQTGSSDEGISGGAAISNATVSADPVTYNGSCPAQVDFTYTVTTTSSGLVQYQLIFTTISPSGYVFDPPQQYSQSVGGATTLSLPYLLISSDSVVATARVKAVGSNTFVSPPLQFTIKCN